MVHASILRKLSGSILIYSYRTTFSARTSGTPKAGSIGAKPDEEHLEQVVATIRDKVHLLPDLLPETVYFYIAPRELR